MQFKLGDLVHIPSGSYRVLYIEPNPKEQMAIPFSFSITDVPKVGVFKEYLGEQECVVLFNDGEFAVATRWVYRKQGEVNNDRTNNNIKSCQ
jgi:hypothetical protein